MSLERVFVTADQRIDVQDYNRTNDYAAANLALALKHLVLPGGFGVMKGLSLVPSDPHSMLLVLKAGAAVVDNGSGNGLCIVEGDTSVGPFSANSSGNPRVDLVSISYQEAQQNETRWFRNPDRQASTPTSIVATPLITITQGTPASSPSAPATPTGHVALAQVLVTSGATTLNATNITRALSAFPLQAGLGPDDSIVGTEVYHSPVLVTAETPISAVTVFYAQATIQVPTGALSLMSNFGCLVRDVDSGVICASGYQRVDGVNSDSPSLNFYSISSFGFLFGPTDGPRRYNVEIGTVDELSLVSPIAISGVMLATLTL